MNYSDDEGWLPWAHPHLGPLGFVSPVMGWTDRTPKRDLPPRTIPHFKLDRTPMEGLADTAVASM